MVLDSTGSGKGSVYRPVNKREFDRNYLRIHGERCPNCKGEGEFVINSGQVHTPCKFCEGLGYVPKKENDCVCGGTGYLEDTFTDGKGRKQKIRTICMLCKKGKDEDNKKV